VRLYQVIYKLVEDVDKALKGLLEPVYADRVIGHAEVRQVFKIKSLGLVAGCVVRDALVQREARAHVLRDGEAIFDGNVHSAQAVSRRC